MVTTFFNSSTLCPLCIWLKPDHPGTCWISEYCWTGRVRIQASSFSYELAIISLSGVYNFPWEFLALRGLVSHSLFQFFEAHVTQIVLASLVVCHISKLPAQVHIWFIMKCIHTSQHLLVDIDVVHSVTSVASDRAFGKLWNEKPMSAFIVLFQNIVRNSVAYSQNSFVANCATGRIQKLYKLFRSSCMMYILLFFTCDFIILGKCYSTL